MSLVLDGGCDVTDATRMKVKAVTTKQKTRLCCSIKLKEHMPYMQYTILILPLPSMPLDVARLFLELICYVFDAAMFWKR